MRPGVTSSQWALIATVYVALLATGTLGVNAQPYPPKSVELVVPFGAGTAPDTVARELARGMSKRLGVLASAREPVFPEVPTAMEQEFAFQSDLWRGIHLPKGAAPSLIVRLEEAVREAVTSPEFQQLGDNVGFLPAYQNSGEFAKAVVADDAVFAQRISKLGLRKVQ